MHHFPFTQEEPCQNKAHHVLDSDIHICKQNTLDNFNRAIPKFGVGVYADASLEHLPKTLYLFVPKVI
ncbi:unnamed protein product [Periconia digitata]|uniref:Uncharacterized protein n=1 Tax=Periconia digitata TaxID=1303443 RepID=A0A9W4XKW2_9PLEO|nr:unnamed protein product [Periconia digitata]